VLFRRGVPMPIGRGRALIYLASEGPHFRAYSHLAFQGPRCLLLFMPYSDRNIAYALAFGSGCEDESSRL
jgi:hypothetical protein